MELIKQAAIRLLLAMCLFVAGCTVVQPWERGNLAKSQMALEPNPLQTGLRAHINGSREAAAVGNAAQGGGCGCY
ncbi:hypothetical protein MGMO_92c00470 [Methyloglobulus morosus KoM1]|uniref:DUF4266 domain-containing protein n=1 Tax=Methyloglobulus morosus KoM1 TaxID=1116472 RepID=V5BEP1_9GAMM|nr:DUF4266 domain-containing protein [Methyloglobulus morosus]ESS71745.1 hypothetical protein MGMO_92c00470 [Methyloglobulus morosus KoM1]